MRRGSHDMQVNVAGIRRHIKNIAHNYSDPQKKVREATSNDPWGPSSTIMAEIADLTYNVAAFAEIMQMVWKRLNDHGRNWRHVYKALVLLEYLIKTGSEKVSQQCKENIFAIQTLKDFQYLEEGKDQGQNVREKAKQLVNLLKDDERLKNERTRALKAKERFAQSASAFGSDGCLDTPTSPRYPAFKGDWNTSRESNVSREMESARPQTAGEEELQLQLALAMSREEAEQEEQKRKSDDVRLQLALSQSQQDFKTHDKPQSHMVDLLDVNLGSDAAAAADPLVDPWGMPQTRTQEPSWQQQRQQSESFASPVSPPLPSAGAIDPWCPVPPKPVVEAAAWGGVDSATKNHDPWSPLSNSSSTDLDEFDIITNRNKTTSPKTNGNSGDPFELNILDEALPALNNGSVTSGPSPSTGATKKTPQSFLGENSALVNLDNLVTTTNKSTNSAAANPFSEQQPRPPPIGMFAPAPVKPSINEMKQASLAAFAVPAISNFSAGFGTNGTTAGAVRDPWTPVPSGSSTGGAASSPWVAPSTQPANPFLS